MSNREKIKRLIQDYIEETPPGGQNNQVDAITRILNEVKLDYQPGGMQISHHDLVASLRNLKTYVQSKSHLWYTIIDEVDITDEWIEEAILELHF